VHGAGKNEGTDQSGHRRQGFSTSSRQSTWQQLLQHFDAKPESVGESTTDRTRLAYDIRSKCREQTAVSRILAMTRRQVLANDIGKRWIRGAGQPLEPSFATDHTRRGFGGQVFFRREMTVEAAMRQTHLLHDVGHTDAVEAPLTEKRSGRVQDLLAVSRRPLARHSHSCPFRKSA